MGKNNDGSFYFVNGLEGFLLYIHLLHMTAVMRGRKLRPLKKWDLRKKVQKHSLFVQLNIEIKMS